MSINIKPSHKGLLHEDLGVPQGQPIPEAAEQQAAHSDDPAVRRRAQFALNARDFAHPGSHSGSHSGAAAHGHAGGHADGFNTHPGSHQHEGHPVAVSIHVGGAAPTVHTKHPHPMASPHHSPPPHPARPHPGFGPHPMGGAQDAETAGAAAGGLGPVNPLAALDHDEDDTDPLAGAVRGLGAARFRRY